MKIDSIKLKPIIESLNIGKIDDKEYFSPKYSAYVSNSRLGNINPDQGGTPEKFFTPMGGIYSDSLVLGSAVHQQYLQPELFELVEIDRPSAKLGFVCDHIWDHAENHILTDESIKEASDAIGYYKNALTEKRIADIKDAYTKYYESKSKYVAKEGIEPMFLSSKMFELANNCLAACNANEDFNKAMHPDYLDEQPISENEQAFLMDIECSFPDRDPIIVQLKSKLDNFVIDFEANAIIVNDLKTLGSILPNFDGEEGNFGRFHYHRELAIYLWLLKLYVEKKYNMINPHMYVNCLVVSTIPGHYTKVYKVTNKEINKGFKEFRDLLKLVAYYIGYEGYGLD